MQINYTVAIVLSCLTLTAFASSESTPESIAAQSGESAIDSVRVTATDHLLIANQKDASNPFGEATNTLVHSDTVRAEYGAYSLKVEFSNRIPLDSKTSLQIPDVSKPFTLEKTTAEAEWSNLDIKLGDSYQELGKGLILSLYRDDVFGIDNTLQGGAIRYHPSGIDATVLAGRVNAINAPVAINAVPDPVANRNVWLGGGQLKVEVAKETKIGGQYLLALEQPLGTNTFDRNWHQAGAVFSKDGLFDSIDIYAESNLMTGAYTYGNVNIPSTNGYGSYGSITWSPDLWKVKLEVKDYRDYDFDFQRPPTLEEDLVDDSNLNNVSGGRLYAERKLADTKTSFNASSLVAFDRNYLSALYHEVVGAKFEALGRTQFEMKAGYRWMPGHNDLAHASLTSKVRTFKGQSIELSAAKQYSNEKLNVIPIVIDRNIFSVYYNFSERWSSGIGYEYVPSNMADLGNNFFNLNVALKRGDITGRVMVGKTSGGTVCSGGVCRQVPPFSGALVESTVVF